jgi:hypothetical protein
MIKPSGQQVRACLFVSPVLYVSDVALAAFEVAK